MGQRDALGLGGDDVVILRRPGQQLPGTGHGQLLVAEDDKTGDGQLVIQRADGQIPFQPCNFHSIVHGEHLLIFYSCNHYTTGGKIVKKG